MSWLLALLTRIISLRAGDHLGLGTGRFLLLIICRLSRCFGVCSLRVSFGSDSSVEFEKSLGVLKQVVKFRAVESCCGRCERGKCQMANGIETSKSPRPSTKARFARHETRAMHRADVVRMRENRGQRQSDSIAADPPIAFPQLEKAGCQWTDILRVLHDVPRSLNWFTK